MYNLLPDEKIRKLRLEYQARLWAVFFIGISLVGAFCVLLMVPSYMLSINKLNSAEQKYSILAQGAAKVSNTVSATTSNSLLTMLDNEEDTTELIGSMQTSTIHDIIAKLVSYGMPGIELNSFSIGPITEVPGIENDGKGTKERSIVLSGNADSRESLMGFLQELRSERGLSGADVPVSILSKSKNISFSFDLVLQIQ